jgi:hypothetical protein
MAPRGVTQNDSFDLGVWITGGASFDPPLCCLLPKSGEGGLDSQTAKQQLWVPDWAHFQQQQAWEEAAYLFLFTSWRQI